MKNFRNYIYMALAAIALVSCSGSPNVVKDVQINELNNKDLLAEVNFARSQPQEYAKILEAMLPYYQGKLYHVPGQTLKKTREGAKAVIEAIDYLKRAAPRAPLYFSNALSNAAMDHVRNQGPTGKVGHLGPDGSNPTSRLQRHGTPVKHWGENIAYGPRTARDVIIQLIIDDGVKDRGHRKLLFRPGLNLAGFGFGYHKTYKNMVVLKFAVDFEEKKNMVVQD